MALGVVIAGALLRRCFVIRHFVINTKIVTQVGQILKRNPWTVLNWILPPAVPINCGPGHPISVLCHGLYRPLYTKLVVWHWPGRFSILPEDFSTRTH